MCICMPTYAFDNKNVIFTKHYSRLYVSLKRIRFREPILNTGYSIPDFVILFIYTDITIFIIHTLFQYVSLHNCRKCTSVFCLCKVCGRINTLLPLSVYWICIILLQLNQSFVN